MRSFLSGIKMGFQIAVRAAYACTRSCLIVLTGVIVRCLTLPFFCPDENREHFVDPGLRVLGFTWLNHSCIMFDGMTIRSVVK